MNKDFTFQNPTRIHFGRSAMSHLSEELRLYGDNVLLEYNIISTNKLFVNKQQ